MIKKNNNDGIHFTLELAARVNKTVPNRKH